MAKKLLSARESRELEDLTRHVREVLTSEWVNTKDMSLRKFAEKAHLSEMTVRNFMLWRTQRPHVQTLIQIAHALGLRLAVVPSDAPRQKDEIRVDQARGLPRARRK